MLHYEKNLQFQDLFNKSQHLERHNFLAENLFFLKNIYI